MEHPRIQLPQTVVSACFDFTIDGEHRSKRTVVITPITCQEVENGKLVVGHACSRGAFCCDPQCWYSKKKESRSREPEYPVIESFGNYGDR